MNVRLTKEQKIKVANSEDVYAIMQEVLLRENKLARKVEHFWVIGLDTKCRIEFIELVALGKRNSAAVEPLDVFHLAAAKNIDRLIAVHNHPSGELKPSKDDKKLTKHLAAGGALLGIELLDHLIITEKSYFSFAEKGLM